MINKYLENIEQKIKEAKRVKTKVSWSIRDDLAMAVRKLSKENKIAQSEMADILLEIGVTNEYIAKELAKFREKGDEK